MLFYFLLLGTNIATAIICTKLVKGKAIYFWLSVIELTLFSGLRGSSTGTDTGSYIIIFNNIANTNTLEGLWNIREEFGFVLLNKIVSVMGASHTVLFIICAFITSYGLLKFINDNTEYLYYATFLLICFMFFFTSMNVVRQYLATAIGINSITLVKRKKYLKSILLIAISILFHKLAILYIVVPIFSWVQNNKALEWIYYILLLVAIVFSKYIITFVANLLNYSQYLTTTDKDDGVMNLILFSAVLLFFVMSCVLNKDTYDKHKYDFLIYSVVYGLILVAKISFSWANRVAWLFSPIVLVLIPNIISNYKTITDKNILYCTISPLAICYFVYCLFINWQGVVPYTFFFQ